MQVTTIAEARALVGRTFERDIETREITHVNDSFSGISPVHPVAMLRRDFVVGVKTGEERHDQA